MLHGNTTRRISDSAAYTPAVDYNHASSDIKRRTSDSDFLRKQSVDINQYKDANDAERHGLQKGDIKRRTSETDFTRQTSIEINQRVYKNGNEKHVSQQGGIKRRTSDNVFTRQNSSEVSQNTKGTDNQNRKSQTVTTRRRTSDSDFIQQKSSDLKRYKQGNGPHIKRQMSQEECVKRRTSDSDYIRDKSKDVDTERKANLFKRRTSHQGFLPRNASTNSFNPMESNKPSVHTSASYGDFEGTASSASGSYYNPKQSAHSAPSSTLGKPERQKRRGQREISSDDTHTSGYSTNSISELSEFSNNRQRTSRSKFETAETRLLDSGDNRAHADKRNRDHRENARDHRDHSRPNSNRLSKPTDEKVIHNRSESNLSVNTSDLSKSSSSKERTRKSDPKDKRTSSASSDSNHKLEKTPTIGNVAVSVTNNIQYDPNDPFSFIQTADLPFHVKVRKCLRPVIVMLFILVLAGALGAAIYFAVELKETHEKQIDLLKANLAMTIRNTGYRQNLDDLSSKDFQFLSSAYCSQMDDFYSKSQFRDSYRGCEVMSIRKRKLNFTLFFLEKEATSSEILAVIETSAVKVEDSSRIIALVDKFELELDTVKVVLELKKEPETFNKIIETHITPKPVATTRKVSSTTAATIGTTTASRKSPLRTQAGTKATTRRPTVPVKTKTGKKVAPKDTPVYSWDPCSEYDGSYFPHPTDCNKFLQCTNDQTIEHTCTTGLLYHWKKLTCVSRFMPKVQCPDPSKAPPRPTTAPSTTTTITTTTTTTTAPTTTTTSTTSASTDSWPSTIDPFLEEFYEDLHTTTPGTTKTGGESVSSSIHDRSAVAGQFPGRPDYPADPCQDGIDGHLYPHPDDCGKFIQCVNGRVQHMTCAPKLVFDPVNKACIFPKNKDLVCPDITPCLNKDDGYFPHPFDCTKFIQCQFKKEVVLTCQSGLIWNPKVNSCVHKTSATVCPEDSVR